MWLYNYMSSVNDTCNITKAQSTTLQNPKMPKTWRFIYKTTNRGDVSQQQQHYFPWNKHQTNQKFVLQHKLDNGRLQASWIIKIKVSIMLQRKKSWMQVEKLLVQKYQNKLLTHCLDGESSFNVLCSHSSNVKNYISEVISALEHHCT